MLMVVSLLLGYESFSSHFLFFLVFPVVVINMLMINIHLNTLQDTKHRILLTSVLKKKISN